MSSYTWKGIILYQEQTDHTYAFNDFLKPRLLNTFSVKRHIFKRYNNLRLPNNIIVDENLSPC